MPGSGIRGDGHAEAAFLPDGDEEGLLARFQMPGQSSVDEAGPSLLVDDLDDDARPHREHAITPPATAVAPKAISG